LGVDRTNRARKGERWLDADEPFAFLAACIELYDLHTRRTGITRIPVAFDATASGYQHICALTRDATGAEKVNISVTLPGEDPADIYGEVANLLRSNPRLKHIHTEIDRKLVKKPVMTFGYSVTTHGMTKQIIEESPHGLDWKSAWQLAQEIEPAIYAILPPAKHMREFLRECTRILSDKNDVLELRMQTGFPWANRYHKSKAHQVRLTLGDVHFRRSSRRRSRTSR
jgi:DNA-directed RNA polymerase